jgi:Bacterial PH domain/Short C-terminal domain/DNA helicase IV / RNA helicase N terminal
MSDKSLPPEKNLADSLPEGVKKNLSLNEQIISYLRTFVIAERTNYIILTNLRLIYFDEKHLGRYTFKSLPFQKLLQVKAHKGAVVWGEVTFKMEDDSIYLLERVPRNELARFIEKLEIAYNSIAVEPVSMKREGALLGMTDWEFNKPAEIVFRQKPTFESQAAGDPLDQLKLRFVRGEISEEEYKAKLRVLQEK